ncbi:PREDICTED: uncharacterized protein LOC104728807 [Camelina sativa]|uniref:Uncharacterized protein LOC104728807 n=1 Tax=Camelina sativa TaxID=90675 RepID=A0ABM0UTE1_CAMSA|nr:PREDICTED: uncharacterized protein LOC104728807 [Camelina sativa]
MSLLFGLVAKHYVEEGDTARFCSYPRQTPYMLFKTKFVCDEDGNYYTTFYLFNPRSEKIITITNKYYLKVSQYLRKLVLLGTSRGWQFLLRVDDSIIYLTNVYNPWSSDSSTKTIALPSLLYTGELIIGSVSLSTPFPDQDGDYIVSISVSGSKLYYCMPNRDSEWTCIDIPFSCDFDSPLVYSWKDQMFYLLTTGCAYMAALDLKNNKKPSFLQIQFENFPLIPQHEWEILASCTRRDNIVESSSSGERFIVQWYVPAYNGNIYVLWKTKRVMVFRKEEEEDDKVLQGSKMIAYYNYTESIGDLCIFIGRNETFCLEASKYPGLRPNSIYYAGRGFGVYDISNRSAREYDLTDFPDFFGHPMCFLSPPLH